MRYVLSATLAALSGIGAYAAEAFAIAGADWQAIACTVVAAVAIGGAVTLLFTME